MAMLFGRELALALAIVALAGTYSFHDSYASDAPKWKRANPGTRAFLGDDGGGVNTATVCDTADRYRDWLTGEHPPGCQTFQHDLPAIIEVVSLDPAIDIAFAAYRPIAKVRIPSRNFTGYISLLGLHPVIPSGAIAYFKKLGNDHLLLFPVAKIPADNNRGVDLGERVSVEVLSYEPTKDDDWDMQVQIIDGPHARETGWMMGFGAVGDDGIPIDQFDTPH